ncbi:fibronectin type III domain-containing protein [Thiothrix subterranea]|uniref:Fibronectin type-III domain-containing protein n=1 Tax=Thiothrix subterranea TaxID=2735563 RepID=A0AA51R5Z5_9GAMM|nr:polysaccharide deacetylase family protein [Thiothrix subterranea]MDQ5766962.1 hypothetical protein [Thiothrix subterranea]WML88176.1 hypothetical protein RCG00_07315 [Thiothrix subterranea]
MRRFLNRLAGLLVLLTLMPAQLFAGGVVLTFDDWFVDQWHDFFVNPATRPPELNGIDLHATFFVAHWRSDIKGFDQGKMGGDSHYVKLKQLENAGHEIASHSVNHLDAGQAPYALACDKAAQYYADEVEPTLSNMAGGDPTTNSAFDNNSDVSFTPTSYSYPYGSGLNVYDNTIKDKNSLLYLRGTLEDRSKPLQSTDAIYHKLGASRPHLIGDGIDFGYDNSVAEIKAALDRASNNDEVITLYGHRILTGEDLGKGLLGIPKADLLEIIRYAHNKGLKFYRFRESFQPVRVAGICDGTPPPPPPPPPPSNVLTAPSNLMTTVVSGTQINLKWQDNSSNEAGFKIERCAGATCTNFAVIQSTGANVVAFNNTGLTAGTVYRYRVRAFKGTLYSSYTTIVNAQTTPKPLTKPTSLKTTVLAGKQIRLNWKDANTTETGFKIERCTGASCTNFAEIASVGANVLTFTNTGLQAGTEYRYQIRAFNSSSFSPYSDRSKGVAKP